MIHSVLLCATVFTGKLRGWLRRASLSERQRSGHLNSELETATRNSRFARHSKFITSYSIFPVAVAVGLGLALGRPDPNPKPSEPNPLTVEGF